MSATIHSPASGTHRDNSGWAAVWLIFAAWAHITGWTLSALGELNRTGYAVSLMILAAALFAWRDLLPGFSVLRRTMQRWNVRRSRLLPGMYLAVFALIFAGGAIHWPNNYDAVTYRLPRVLHWWSTEQWHWIGDVNRRMDFSGVGFEWMQLPVMVLTGTDRWLFLLNFLPGLLLPGLLFSVFRGLGIASRTAWSWMWLLPLGFCFVLESGSTSNDTIAAISLLSSLHFSLRGIRTRRTSDLVLAMLAASLTTSFKASNLPLMLPCAILLWPALRAVRPSSVALLAGGVVALAMSFAPMAVLNTQHAGHWGGDPDNSTHHQVITPVSGIIGNGLQGLMQNFAPPLLPAPRRVEAAATDLLPENLKMRMNADFPRFSLRLNELPQEENAGLGLPLSLVVLLALFAALRNAGTLAERFRTHRPGILLGLGGCIAALVFMVKMGSESTARLMTPYYAVLLVPVLACGAPTRWYRGRIFLLLAGATGLSALMAVTLTPSRPLWPALTILNRFAGLESTARARNVYQIYRNRHDLMQPIRRHLPPEVSVVGWAADEDDSELGLWRPFGARKLVSLTPQLAATPVRDLPFDWLVIKARRVDGTSQYEKIDLKRLREGGFEVVARETIIFKFSVGPEDWLLLGRVRH